MKDKKILGAERGSLEGGSPPDDRASRAGSQHSLSHNMVPLFVNRGDTEFRSWGTERHECQTMSLNFHFTTQTQWPAFRHQDGNNKPVCFLSVCDTMSF